jgi:hypothetical protein
MDDYIGKSFKKSMAESSKGMTVLSAATDEMVVHKGTICDQCGISPILGVRYTCMFCQKFDICESCEDLKVHPASHPMIKLKQPIDVIEMERCD